MTTIPELARKALVSFRSLEAVVEADKPTSTEALRLHMSRFKLWAGSVGAHRPSGHRSLEYRLSGALKIRKHVVTLLGNLCKYLNEADTFNQSDDQEQHDDGFFSDFFDDDDPELDEFQQTLLQIKNVVDCLMRLSVMIRNPAPHEQFKSRMPALESSLVVKYIEHLEYKFPRLRYNTAENLAKSLTHRRLYFRYREEHHGRLVEGIDDQGESRGGATTEASWLPKDKHQDSVSRPNAFRDDLSDMTATSYAPSCADGSELRVPRIPQQHVDGPFICPYCYLPVFVENRYQWKQHVYGDLRPYVCLEDTCHLVDNSFARRKDWITHMAQEHWRTWVCPFGCDGCLPTASRLSKHLSQNHGSETTNSDANIYSKLNMELAKGTCPLCWEYEINSSRQYQSHVGNHLEQLALFVLPSAQEADEEVDEEMSEGKDSRSESEHQKSEDEALPIEHVKMEFGGEGQYGEEVDEEESSELDLDHYVSDDDSRPTGNTQERKFENMKKGEQESKLLETQEQVDEEMRLREEREELEARLKNEIELREMEARQRMEQADQAAKNMIDDEIDRRQKEDERKRDEEERWIERQRQHEDEVARRAIEKAQAEERERQEQASRLEVDFKRKSKERQEQASMLQADFERKFKEDLNREANARRRDD